MAKRHPDVYFEHAGGWMMSANFGNYFGNTQAAWYPMGVAAGKMTKTNKLGFVIGVPIGFAVGNVNAFELGARSVNPDAQTTVVVTGGWSDKAKEAAAANALLDQGCDVLAMHVDSPATIIQTAESRGAMSIGFQSIEARALAPRGWITGLGFTWAPYFTEVAKSVMAGTFKASSTHLGLGEGMVTIAPFGAAVPAEVRKLVTASADKIAKGFNPFTGPSRQHRGGPDPGQGKLGRRQDGQLQVVRRRGGREGPVAHDTEGKNRSGQRGDASPHHGGRPRARGRGAGRRSHPRNAGSTDAAFRPSAWTGPTCAARSEAPPSACAFSRAGQRTPRKLRE